MRRSTRPNAGILTLLSEYLSVDDAVSGGNVRTFGSRKVRPSLPIRSCTKIGHARSVTAAPTASTRMSGSATTASTVPTTMSTPRLTPTQHLGRSDRLGGLPLGTSS